MRKRLHKSFEELVKENRQQLLNDAQALEVIEKKVEDKQQQRQNELQKA
ncbi:FbpB family small basic protein [Evansella tamaricis]|uniref:FbpB family small basic protein n=1 Tax=Evansella tamaricis TaxID=2069301 RepID=A0ABS6J9I0_9BACI|nr:FbpB family small basic protein [Evansella tamaricis]MBU9710339.1 FbpB family small basic protein [Evansella tamaricis]